MRLQDSDELVGTMEGEQFDMIAKTLYGLEDVLADELTALNAREVKAGHRMVSFRGDKAMMYRANYYCRTALRILKPVCRFKADDADTVYSEVKKIAWDQFFLPDRTIAVDAVIYSESFKHSKFVAYRVKDAIADYFAEKYDKRPSVRINRPDMYIHIHISHRDCTVALDSSGESLHKRGYRTAPGEAPLNETLAAGMILKTGWHGQSHFVDPMCGSGTLLIEAAMIALNVPPGLFRKEYAFERWDDFDQELFRTISEDESEEHEFAFKCFGSDISPKALKTAENDIKNAGLSKYVELKTLPFQQYVEVPRPGILVTNPPYGERIQTDDLMGLYAMLGERLKHVFTGYQAWILSCKEECFEKIGLRPNRKIKLMNGQLECEFRCYELFEGKNKDYKILQSGQNYLEQKASPLTKSSETEKPLARRQPPFAGDKPVRKSFSDNDRSDRPVRKSFSDEDRPFRPLRKSFSDNDRPNKPVRKSFSDNDWSDRPVRKSFSDEDRPFRPLRKSFSDNDRPDKPVRRSFSDDDRSFRPVRRSFSDNDRADKPVRRSFSDDDRSFRPVRKSFSDNDRADKPGRKSFSDDDRPFRPGRKPLPDKDRSNKPVRKSFSDNDRPDKPVRKISEGKRPRLENIQKKKI
jgi:putative N6-adenine-specific DNA methylase